jgi:hypothetical protein
MTMKGLARLYFDQPNFIVHHLHHNNMGEELYGIKIRQQHSLPPTGDASMIALAIMK